jgi:hypothetical protein
VYIYIYIYIVLEVRSTALWVVNTGHYVVGGINLVNITKILNFKFIKIEIVGSRSCITVDVHPLLLYVLLRVCDVTNTQQ